MFGAICTLGVALLLAVPVIERYSAGAWQWYKFYGYSNDGHISLSLGTARLFSGLLAVTFVLALLINRFATQRVVTDARAISFWAMCVLAAIAIAYWLLALSSLNAWRA